MKVAAIVLSLCVSWACGMVISTGINDQVSPIWPAPKEFQLGNQDLQVSNDFTFACSQNIPTLDKAFKRYHALTFPHIADTKEQKVALSSLQVTVDNADESHPQLATDESYSLEITAGGSAKLSAKTVYGAMHGLESFSQLVRFDFNTKSYHIASAPISIKDAPRFPHRGLMMDTARHFEALPAIRAVIDSLPYSKINVLHWHMSDSQSFPLQIKSHPNLWSGAWSEEEKYTQEDVASIVEYARERGIRVMVEFDVPGHAQSWCKGYPEVCPSQQCTTPLNVANNFTFQVISDILKECTGGKTSSTGHPSGLFPDDFVHLGGDEVNTNCWSKVGQVHDWLQLQNMTEDQAYAYFAKRVSQIAISQGRRPVQWSEVYDHFKTELDKRTVVHIWKAVTNVTEVVADGYQVLLNVGYFNESWYLDNLNVKWDAVYANEPCKGVPDDLCHLIIGGHGEMWGETVDASDIEQTVWPRLAAIGERLWSPRTYTDVKGALPRIEEFRCLLNRRGIRAAPVNNANARQSPSGPGSCRQ